jgi:hypothetical protein
LLKAFCRPDKSIFMEGENPMEELTKNPASPEEPQGETLGRRELLKALAATGGAVTAATLLPGKWTKPVIQVGVLPAHAATSALLIDNLEVDFAGAGGVNATAPATYEYFADFDYIDGLCEVDGDTLLFAAVSPDGELDFSGSAIKDVGGATVGEDPCMGKITFPFTMNASKVFNDSVLYVKIKAGDRESNEESQELPPPTM